MILGPAIINRSCYSYLVFILETVPFIVALIYVFKNIKFILPVGETVETFRGHNARAKDKISFDEVLKKSLELIS